MADQLREQERINALSSKAREALTVLLESGPDNEAYQTLDATVEEIMCLAITLMGETPCK